FKAGELTINPNAKRYTSETTPKQEVILAPYDAKNIYMVQYHNENRDWTPDNAAVNALFNEYFGGGMNAIVFQELREARGLAYSAYAGYNEPSRKSNKESFNTYIITQNDKMTDCINEFNNLLNNMPQRPAGFELAKQSLMKSLATNRTNKFDILNAYINAQRLGIDYDINKKIYETLPSLQMKDLTDFAKSRISNKTYKYIILGNEKELNMPTLEKIGNIKRLSLEQIFGF
nr:insulinase family protein [Prevotella sp.]